MIWQSHLLKTTAAVGHAFSRRIPGVPGYGNTDYRFGNTADTDFVDRQLLAKAGLTDYRLVLLNQIHSDTIREVTSQTPMTNPLTPSLEGDAMVTNCREVALGIRVADCICLLLADRQGRAVGAAHAGWRGSFANISGQTVERLKTLYGVAPQDLLAWISPHICKDCYSVSEQLADQFAQRWGEEVVCRTPPKIDLATLNRYQLEQTGIPTGQIETSPVCSYENHACFSHRRGDQPMGRMMGVIGLRHALSHDHFGEVEG